MRPQGATTIAAALHTNSVLHTLYMSASDIGPTGAARLADALVANPGPPRSPDERTPPHTVTSLYIAHNQIRDAGLISIATALHEHHAIASLELSFNYLTHRSIESLAHSLYGYTSLQFLLLDNNIIGDIGIHHLAVVLPTMSLRVLNVAFNQISTSGIEKLMGVVRDHKTLVNLTLTGNRLDEDGAMWVASAMNTNSVLKHLALEHTGISESGQVHIVHNVLTNPRTELRSLPGCGLSTIVKQFQIPNLPEVFRDVAAQGYTNEEFLHVVRVFYSNPLNAPDQHTSTMIPVPGAAEIPAGHQKKRLMNHSCGSFSCR